MRTISPKLVPKRDIPQLGEADIEKRAIFMLALMKRDEERLVKEAQIMHKLSSADSQKIFSTDVEGWTLFHACALKGCRKVIKIALKSGVDANLKMGEPEGVPGGCSALHLASHRGDVSIIDILLANNADVNQNDNSGNTPIYYAVSANNKLAAKTLRRAGAVTDKSDSEDSNAYVDHPSIKGGTFCFLPIP